MKISGIILAGGMSIRMGNNKALLTIGGLPMIERVSKVLSGVCQEIIIAGGNQSDMRYLGYPLVPDIYPGFGPLSGIHAGLVAAHNHYCFVSACDTPFLDERLISKLVSEAQGYDAVILKHQDYFEPLTSLYSKAFIEAAETSIKNGIYKVTNALSLIKWKAVTLNSEELTRYKKSLININTPTDYEEAKKLEK